MPYRQCVGCEETAEDENTDRIEHWYCSIAVGPLAGRQHHRQTASSACVAPQEEHDEESKKHGTTITPSYHTAKNYQFAIAEYGHYTPSPQQQLPSAGDPQWRPTSFYPNRSRLLLAFLRSLAV